MQIEVVATAVESDVAGESRLGRLYARIYSALCGKHPVPRFWHFQWLATYVLYADLRRALSRMKGRVLDVGCGDKPYERWFHDTQNVVGIDVYNGPKVDHVLVPGKPWPVGDAQFDVVLCTQVMEHAMDLENVLTQIDRALKPGGELVVSVPFIYNQHGAPCDFRRLSLFGVRQLFADRYDILDLKPQGGIGSTLGILLLNWLDAVGNLSKPTRILKALLLPLWLFVCLIVNAFGWLLDRLDGTSAFYGNVLLVAKKRLGHQLNDRLPKPLVSCGHGKDLARSKIR